MPVHILPGMTWNTVANASAYEVYRGTTNNSASAVKLELDATGSSFDDSTIVVGTPYYYWAKAKNAAGSSAFSSSDMGYASSSGTDTRWLPVVGDYDGDRLADPAIYNPANGDWSIRLSSGGHARVDLPGFLGGME